MIVKISVCSFISHEFYYLCKSDFALCFLRLTLNVILKLITNTPGIPMPTDFPDIISRTYSRIMAVPGLNGCGGIWFLGEMALEIHLI